ncbi:PLDc N-terminal domain-containing protein [Cellulosimicrobium arenosum]|uniref:PLDc N-terminal domain-containing protein n=1 Tax=Cellulosimicrobium arenosum TaxID=2708133 RepID=A0A927PCK4_9MICO|nr:PLDc N-terminal domain-containing protein [Cellulosimicrobium arenosum]MBD8079546.1 PLDc N-terminal domain-containing protein [Cellulosimicrobium arenosum]
MDTFWDWFGLMIWWFFLVMYLVILFQIIGDLFRDRHLSGWWKAVWLLALVVVPFLTALIYLVARGRGMAERHAERLAGARADTEAYIRGVSGASAASQISDAKALLDAGTIDEREFAALKAKALA